MALDQRKRQKKVERRNQKQKERRTRAQANQFDLGERLRRASSAPILHCCAAASIRDQGIGNVLISRLLPSGSVAFVNFLVDSYCLGVKNLHMSVTSRGDYETHLYDKVTAQATMIKMTPAAARKLVEGAVAYALDLGITPYPEYPLAREIFGDIDAGACQEEFVFGKDGKPLFIAGPYDDPVRCRYINDRLRERCGDDGFHFIIPWSSTTTVGPVDGPQIIQSDDVIHPI